MLTRLITFVKKEPVRTEKALIAIVTLAVTFGWLKLTTEQNAAILGVLTLVLGSGEAVRSAVTPNASLPTEAKAQLAQVQEAKDAVADAAVKAAEDPHTP